MTNTLHKGDLPDNITFSGSVAIDTETMGLVTARDPLCVVQLSAGDGNAHVVQIDRSNFDAPNLKRLMTDESVTKIFHFARFDIAAMQHWLGVVTAPVYCTKIASKLARTYTDRHSLKDLTRELLGVDMSKQQQSSDWGAEKLSKAQIDYAASDVLYLHKIQATLDIMLARADRTEIAAQCFDFLPTRAALDLAGWPEVDIFAHS